MFEAPTKLTIIYKSGVKVRVTVKSYKFSVYANGDRKFEWDTMRPKPVDLNISEIAAIFEGKV